MSIEGASCGGWGSSSSSSSTRSRWFACVRETLELMAAVLNRELPAAFVARHLLPKVRFGGGGGVEGDGENRRAL